MQSIGKWLLVIAILVLMLPTIHLGMSIKHRMNQDKAITSMIAVRNAQKAYLAAEGRYGNWEELVAAKLLKPALADNQDWGYQFEIRATKNAYSAIAMPVKYGKAWTGTGYISLFLDESGIIRFSFKGVEPDINSDPLASHYQQD